MIGEPRPSRSYRPRPDRPLVLEARDRPCRLWTLLGRRSSPQGRARLPTRQGSTIRAMIPPPVAMPAPGKRGWEVESKVSARILTHRHRLRRGRKKKRPGDAGRHRPDGTAACLFVQALRQRFMGHQNWHAPEECATLRSLSKNRGGGNSRTCPCTLHTTLRSFCDRGAVVCHRRG